LNAPANDSARGATAIAPAALGRLLPSDMPWPIEPSPPAPKESPRPSVLAGGADATDGVVTGAADALAGTPREGGAAAKGAADATGRSPPRSFAAAVVAAGMGAAPGVPFPSSANALLAVLVAVAARVHPPIMAANSGTTRIATGERRRAANGRMRLLGGAGWSLAYEPRQTTISRRVDLFGAPGISRKK